MTPQLAGAKVGLPSSGARRHVRRALLAAALALAAAPAHAQLALSAPLPPLAERAPSPSPALLIPVAGVAAAQLRDSYHAGREGGGPPDRGGCE